MESKIIITETIAVGLKNFHKLIGNIFMGKREFGALEIGLNKRKNVYKSNENIDIREN